MTAKDLKKLRRSDLLEMLLELSKENMQLREQLEQTQKQLENRTIAIENAGSLAEAALQLNGIFEAAQAACEQYTQNIHQRSEQQEQICRQMELETRAKCDEMLAEAQKKVDSYLEAAHQKAKERTGTYSWLAEIMDSEDGCQ